MKGFVFTESSKVIAPNLLFWREACLRQSHKKVVSINKRFQLEIDFRKYKSTFFRMDMEWNRLDNHERPPCKSSEMGVAIGGEKVEEFCPK